MAINTFLAMCYCKWMMREVGTAGLGVFLCLRSQWLLWAPAWECTGILCT